jgi:3-dehydroquinate synthase
MKENSVSIKLNAPSHQYEIQIGHENLPSCGDWARKSLSENTSKIAIISNPKVFSLYGEIVRKSVQKAGFEVVFWLMKDGEKYKNLRSLETALAFLNQNKITRTDAVIALGGGVVGDLAGFAAAIHLRGVPFLQIPTTLLAMIDSSVGGKTGVNSSFGKNLVGAFHQPNGVLLATETLKTLPSREIVAGFCEAVKHGAISSEELFQQTSDFLKKYPTKNFKTHFFDQMFLQELEKLLNKQVSFKAEIVMNDERESSERIDGKSRKTLNFGHTLAHALEKVTEYKYFKHGEAVGYGILFAAELSKTLDIFNENKLTLLNDVVARVGVLPKTDNIDLRKVFEAFKFDKKTVGSSLQWILLEDIGKPVIFSNTNIPESAIQETLKKILRK